MRELASAYPEGLSEASPKRPLLARLPGVSDAELTIVLDEERNRERELDKAYWRPLRLELETMRRGRGG